MESIRIRKRNGIATISTLFEDWFRVWPITMTMPNYRKNIDNF